MKFMPIILIYEINKLPFSINQWGNLNLNWRPSIPVFRAKLTMVVTCHRSEWLLLHLEWVVVVADAEVIEAEAAAEDEDKDSEEGEEEDYQGQDCHWLSDFKVIK